MINMMQFLIMILFLILFLSNQDKMYFIPELVILCIVLLNYYKLMLNIKQKESLLRDKKKLQNEYFITLLNHDLKIPLLAQLRGMELLTNEITGKLNNEQKNIIIDIEHSCKDVLGMIGMIVKTYSIENNSCKLEYEKFNINEILAQCFEDITGEAREKNLTIDFSCNTNNITIEADKAAIRKLITNLLSNAVSYSTIGGTIKILLKATKKNMSFTISGMGLGSTSWNFKESGNCNKYTTIGHNIKMYLCGKIIEFHKGKIFIRQNNRFPNSLTFVLPRFSSQSKNGKYLAYV